MWKLIAALLCLATGPAWALLAIVADGPQHASGSCCTFVNHLYTEDTSGASGFSLASSGTMNITAGNLVVVGCRLSRGGAPLPTVTVTGTSNTYTAINTASATPLDNFGLFYAKNATASATETITCNYSDSSQYTSVEAIQYSGASTTVPLDQNNTGTGTGTTITCGSMTTTAANEVVVAFGSAGAITNTYVAGSGFTLRGSAAAMSFAEDKVLTGTATLSADLTNIPSLVWEVTCASFK